jgi:hypothetical protein
MGGNEVHMSLSTASTAVWMLLAIGIAMPLGQLAVQQTLMKKELKALTVSAKTAADQRTPRRILSF